MSSSSFVKHTKSTSPLENPSLELGAEVEQIDFNTKSYSTNFNNTVYDDYLQLRQKEKGKDDLLPRPDYAFGYQGIYWQDYDNANKLMVYFNHFMQNQRKYYTSMLGINHKLNFALEYYSKQFNLQEGMGFYLEERNDATE